MSEQMHAYYAQRAPVYEAIYRIPERQGDLQELQEKICAALHGKNVLEVACGTGFWTERYAPLAGAVLATDVNQAMLDLAQGKAYPDGRVRFVRSDLYDLPAAQPGQYSACFAGFLWSHIRREEQAALLEKFRAIAGAGSMLILADNNYVEGSSSPVARTDAAGNTWQLREQLDGSRVEIVKNFPTDSFLRKKLAPASRDIRIFRNRYYWMLSCVLK